MICRCVWGEQPVNPLECAQPRETSRPRASAQLPAGLAAGLPAKKLAPRAPQCLFECTVYNPDTYHHIIVCIWFFLQHPLKVQLGIFHLSRLADLPLPFPREPKSNFPRATSTLQC